MSLFGLEIGKRSIMAQQTALEVTGHNLANANTPGYTRQIPNLVTTRPYHTPALISSGKVGQLGTGVMVSDIQRIRDAFLDEQIRNESKTSGYWNARQNALAKVEVILNEPSNDGLRAVMDMYWESWQDLVAHPESEAVRTTVAERGAALADAFNHMHTQLKELRDDLNASVKIKVDEINVISGQIADLNLQIQSIKIAGKQPNDLEDQRDLLIDQLSQIVDIKTYTDSNGMVAVQMGGRALVQGNQSSKLTTKQDNQGMHMVIWADTKTRAVIESGELKGLLDDRGKTDLSEDKGQYLETVPNLIDNLNKLAKTIVIKTNELHRGGYSLNNPNGALPDGINFFNAPADPDSITDWAQFIKVNNDILKDPKNIAAAAQPTLDAVTGEKINFGDGSIAMAIANLKHDLNSEMRTIKSGDMSGQFTGTLPVNITQSFDITYGGTTHTINIAADVSNLNELAQAVQDALNNEGLDLKVSLDGSYMMLSTKSNSPVSVSGFWGTTGNLSVSSYDLVSNATTDDYWRSICAEVGVKSQEAVRMVKNQEVLLSQLESKRQSISGVSLDEEITNMIKFQHAYNAASRFITTMDEAIDVIVNRMGLVGR